MNFQFIPYKSASISSTFIDNQAYIYLEKYKQYICFNKSGSFIWSLVDGRNTLEDIVTCCEKKYSSDKNEIYIFVDNFIKHLQNFNLISDRDWCVRPITISGNKNINELYKLATKKVIPLDVTIEITSQCNQNCIHCYIDDKSRIGNLSIEHYDILFDQLVEAGTLFVTITGGEPFTHPDIIKILEKARSRRLSVTILTNGSSLPVNIENVLSKIGVFNVEISIFSDNEKLHDRITETAGSHRIVLKNIKKLKKSGINILLKCPLMSLNFHSISNLKHLASSLGVRILFSQTIMAKNNGDYTPLLYRMSQEQLRETLKDPDITDQNISKINTNDSYQCEDLFCGGCIDIDGNILLCSQLREKGGNFLKKAFSEVWENNDQFWNIRSIRMNDLASCSTCELLSYCARCPGLALLEDGDIRGCSSTCKYEAEARKDLGLFV